MQRIINFRACLIVFIGAIVGVIFSLQIIQQNNVFIALSLIIVCSISIFALFSLIINFKKFIHINKFLLTFLLGFIVFITFGVVDYKVFYRNIESVSNAKVVSRVDSVSEYNGYTFIFLEDCSVNGDSFDGKIMLVVYYEDEQPNIKLGDTLDFSANLIKSEILENGEFNSYAYKHKIKYLTYLDAQNIAATTGELKVDEKVREWAKNLIFDNLTYNNASICYAALFGDKTTLDYGIKSAFSISGTSHLLCVSGLHVGFVTTLIYFFLNLCKIKKKHSFLIVVFLLIFYSYLCEFSPSVVRAAIMTITFTLADCSGKVRYDSLSALGFSGTLILLINPFYIFDLGFELSFASCAGIIVLTPLFKKLFQKIHFDNALTEVFSVSLAAQIGTYPILLHNFDKLSFVSLCANVVIVPLFSLIFMFSIVCILINGLLPLGFLFQIIEYGLNLVIFLTKGFGAINSLVFLTSPGPIMFSCLFYFIAIFISEFVNFSPKTKTFVALFSVILMICTFLSQFYPINYEKNLLINSSSENFTIVTNKINQKVLISVGTCDEEDVSLLKSDLLNLRIINIDCFILVDYNEEMQDEISQICNNYNIKFLFVSSNITSQAEVNLLNELNSTSIMKTDDGVSSFSNFSFRIYSNISSVLLNIADASNSSILIANSLNEKTLSVIKNANITADYLKTNSVTNYQLSQVENFRLILCYQIEQNQSNVFKIFNFCDKIVLGQT